MRRYIVRAAKRLKTIERILGDADQFPLVGVESVVVIEYDGDAEDEEPPAELEPLEIPAR